MDEFNMRVRSHVPAFGSWGDCYDHDMPFTQCFESARQAAGLQLRYSYSDDRDLYVAGDLYDNDVVTPAMIVVPRHRGKTGYPKEKEGKKEGRVVYDCDPTASPPPRPPPKAVDEDLYKISPSYVKRKGAWSFFSSCLRPARVC